MASLVPLNFSEYRPVEKPTDENNRPDSPTVMITKSKPRGQLLSDSTLYLIQTYESCSSEFRYDQSCPARCLTKPSEAVHNENYDNEDYNYILYVNDKLQSPEGQVYVIIDSLGEGTFGQVVKCRDSQGLLCAAKVIKNKPAYYIQGLIEVKILSKLNNELDSNDSSHIVRMKDFFVFRNHLVIIFELLSLNLYEILRKNLLRGVSLSLIRKFTKQMLEALCVLEKGNIIHCDMKPENVLLADDKANIKVIDFGSACFENATIYTYIQSRYYRSPEVLLGCPYGSEIDSWSLGCICAELFIGIPLFPGANDYDQIYRITQILGTPPESMLREGRFHDKYFTKDPSGYRLKSREEFMQSENKNIPQSTVFINLTSLDDLLILDRKLPREDSSESSRAPFIHFLKGLLQLDPAERWTASQAYQHPFIQDSGPASAFNPVKKPASKRSVPSGTFRGSCPQILQSIRGSQDMSVQVKDVCFRPLVEELKDDFFTGFAHGKLMQVQKPVVSHPPPTSWQNPFMNMPMNLQTHKIPQPDIVGPRYQRPHSYEEHSGIPRPFSPKIQTGMWNKKKKMKNAKKVSFTKIFNERPGSNDEKGKQGEKLIKYTDVLAITEKKIDTRAVSSTGYLNRVRGVANELSKKDN